MRTARNPLPTAVGGEGGLEKAPGPGKQTGLWTEGKWRGSLVSLGLAQRHTAESSRPGKPMPREQKGALGQQGQLGRRSLEGSASPLNSVVAEDQQLWYLLSFSWFQNMTSWFRFWEQLRFWCPHPGNLVCWILDNHGTHVIYRERRNR